MANKPVCNYMSNKRRHVFTVNPLPAGHSQREADRGSIYNIFPTQNASLLDACQFFNDFNHFAMVCNY